MGAPLSFLTLPQRLRPSAEQWNAFAWQLVCDLRVALPCVVESFDPVRQTIEAQPVIQEKINKNLVPTDVDLPLLVDIPIVLPRAGLYALTLPIQKGDECLVVFADMCIDAWWQSGAPGENNGKTRTQVQMDKRRHDLSDGFAIIGCWSQPRKLENYSTSSIQLRTDDGTTFLEVINGQVFVTDNLVVGNGATGTFTSQDGRSVTVQNGIVVNIA